MIRKRKRKSNVSYPEGMKRCSICKEVKQLEAFNKATTSLDGAQGTCRTCVREHHRKLQALINDLKRQPCTDCGQTFHPAAMDFDHLPGAVKVRAIARMTLGTVTKLLKEIDKCELVCSNCHRVRTFNRLQEVNHGN